MKRVLQMWLLALAVLVGVSAVARPSAQEGTPRSHGEMSSRLSRRGSFGRIHVQGGMPLSEIPVIGKYFRK